MQFDRYQIPKLDSFVATSKHDAISLVLEADKCVLFEFYISPTPQLKKNTDITAILPEMDKGLLYKAVKAVSKSGKFAYFSVDQLFYANNVLTAIFSASDVSYAVYLSIQPDINVVLSYRLSSRPISVAYLGNDVYIAFSEQLQKLDYGKNYQIFKDLGQDKIVQITVFKGKLAMLLFSNSLVLYDPITQQYTKIRMGNVSYIASNDYSVVGFSRNAETLSISVVEPEQYPMDGYNVHKFQFTISAQYYKLEMLGTVYSDNFLVVFFNDNVNPPFCLAISQTETQSAAHQILEMTTPYLKAVDIQIYSVTRIIESKANVYEAMQNSYVNPLIAYMFDCTEPFYETKTQIKKINQVGEIKCKITTLSGVYEDSVYHQKYLLCKGLLLNDFPISELFGLSGSLFQQFKLIKPLSDIHPNIYMYYFVRDAYCATSEKLPEVVVFACLRYYELLPFLEFLVNRQEQRLDAQGNMLIYSMANVRPLAAFLYLVVESSCQFLDIAFEQFTRNQEDLTLLQHIEQLDNLQTIVQSSVKIMQILVETREKNGYQESQEIIRQANYIIMSGRTFISISKIIKCFSSLGQSRSLLDITVPLTNDGAAYLGLHDSSFSAQELSQSTFVNEEIDHVVEGNASILYTQEYGFYQIGEDMVVQPLLSVDIPNYDDLYRQLNMDGNTAIFSVISSICQIFAGGQYVRLTLRNILEYILHSRAYLKYASNFVIKQFEAAIFSVVLIFGYIKMMRNYNQTEIFTFISDILPYVQEKTKITNQLFLLCKIFATIDSAGSENDTDINIVLRTYDNYRLYNELLLFGAGKLQDDQMLRDSLPSALQRLPLPFSMRDDLADDQIRQQTGILWATRLSQLACTRKQFNLAKALANFSAAIPFSYYPILWPYHPCETGTELFLRACLVDYVLNRTLYSAVAFVTQIRVFLNSFAATESDCVTNRRIASLYAQAALNYLYWENLYKLSDDAHILPLEENALYSSGYQCKVRHLYYWRLPSALIMYYSITDVEKRVILSFALQNGLSYDFILAFLFYHDLCLCQYYVYALTDTQQVSSGLFKQIYAKLSIMPRFLHNSDLRATRLFSSTNQFAYPTYLLPTCFIDDMGRELQELEKSLAKSNNLSATQLLYSKQEEEAPPVVINQQAGMMNFLDLMRYNRHIQNVKCVVGMPYYQPTQAQPVYARNVAGQWNRPTYPQYVPQQYNAAFYPAQYAAPATSAEMYPLVIAQAKVQPVVRYTKAQMLRDYANKLKIEEQNKKEAARISYPRYTLIGYKQVGIKLYQGYYGMLAYYDYAVYYNNYQPAAAYAYPYNTYAYPTYEYYGYPAYNQYYPTYYYPAPFYGGYQYQAQQWQKPQANPFAKYAPYYRNFNPSYQPSYQYPSAPSYTSIQKPAFNYTVYQPYDLSRPSAQNPYGTTAKPSFNPSFEPSIYNAAKINAAPAQPRRATFAPTNYYISNEMPMQNTAQYQPQPATKPGILKNKMNFRTESPVVKAKNGVAFDITF